MKRIGLSLLMVFLLMGCRGWRSEKPPIHLNPNMDFQASIRPQEAPLPFPDHVVPWGMEDAFFNQESRDAILKTKRPSFYLGKNKTGEWVDDIPVLVNHELLRRGRERFNIYCSMCHGQDGSGKGIVMDYGWFNPQPYWAEHVVNYQEGKLFDIISNGIRTMSGYSQQLSENDRWAIVAYIRALQVSHTMSAADLSEDVMTKLKSKRK
jgi:mono/diheme cytochrome c family protein